MTERPAACPICGSQHLQIVSEEAAPYQYVYRVVCECGASGKRQVTAALAVACWNEGAGWWLIHRYDIEIEVI